MDKTDKILVAGDNTLIGSFLMKKLANLGFSNLTGSMSLFPDLTDSTAVRSLFEDQRPDYVFLVAGKSGGIFFNQNYPAELMIDNLVVESNVIHNSYVFGVTKLLYLASSCCYPKECLQPMKVEYLLTGALESTNEAYAVAKIAGIKLCQAYSQQYGVNFTSGIPGDVFGPGDDFSPDNSHVLSGLMRRIYKAKKDNSRSVDVWGTGKPQREFIYAEDMADACIFIMNNYSGRSPINIGSGDLLRIGELAEAIKEVIGYLGTLRFDTTKADGMPLKALDSGELRELGWRPKTLFRDGLIETYKWFLESGCANE